MSQDSASHAASLCEMSEDNNVEMDSEGSPDQNTRAYAKLEGVDFTYFIRTLSVTLGRCTRNNQVDIDLGTSSAISRLHAKIEYNFNLEQFVLYPLGKNGVYINGQLFKRDIAYPLESRTAIQIGDACFYFLLPVGHVTKSMQPLPRAPLLHVHGPPSPNVSSSMITQPCSYLATRDNSRCTSPTPNPDRSSKHFFTQALNARLGKLKESVRRSRCARLEPSQQGSDDETKKISEHFDKDTFMHHPSSGRHFADTSDSYDIGDDILRNCNDSPTAPLDAPIQEFDDLKSEKMVSSSTPNFNPSTSASSTQPNAMQILYQQQHLINHHQMLLQYQQLQQHRFQQQLQGQVQPQHSELQNQLLQQQQQNQQFYFQQQHYLHQQHQQYQLQQQQQQQQHHENEHCQLELQDQLYEQENQEQGPQYSSLNQHDKQHRHFECYQQLPNLQNQHVQNNRLDEHLQRTELAAASSPQSSYDDAVSDDAGFISSDSDSLWLTDPKVKPPYSYAVMIAQAIQEREDRKQTLAGIYKFISHTYPYFGSQDPSGWQNSIRHNLSLNKNFIRVPRGPNEPGKGSFWTIEPGAYREIVKDLFKKKSRGPKVKSRPKRPSRLSQLTITRRSGFRKLSLHEAAQTFQGLTGSSPSNTVTQARIKLSSTGRAPPTQTGSATTIGTVHTSVSKEQSCSGWTGQIEVVSNPRIGEIACHVVGQNAPLSQHSLLPELQTTGSVHSDLLNSSNIHQNQQHISSTSNISISEIENTPIVALATSTALPYVQLEHQPDPIQEQNLSLPPFQVLSPKSNFPNLESSSSTSFKAHTSTSPNWVSRLKESGADCDKEYHHISTHAMTQEDNHPNFEKKSLCPSISHSSTKNVSPFLLPVSRPSENALVPQEPSLSTIPPTFATSHKCQNSDSAHFKPSFVGSDEAS